MFDVGGGRLAGLVAEAPFVIRARGFMTRSTGARVNAECGDD
ncbi:hypothetical protein PAMC26577_10380 [Caballeronia sordidicola]|uniref:Uncharacterized protein n=1 Tax=Caballeronia sordidicola TaxID=196367 RepID=A0A242MZA3_CABSO|nr:hypothetical protein PAMC26577_10380 [Caballeronia sordidicola]